MNQFEEMAMDALIERDMAVRAIADFLEVLDANRFTEPLVTLDGKPTGKTTELLDLSPPLQTSSIHQLRMVLKTLGAKAKAS